MKKKEQALELLVNMGTSFNEGFVYSPKQMSFLIQQIDQLYQPFKIADWVVTNDGRIKKVDQSDIDNDFADIVRKANVREILYIENLTI